MPFDLKQARRDGVTDREIADYLADHHGFDISKARSEGVTDSDVVNYLTSKTIKSAEKKPMEPTVPKWGEKSPTLFGMYGAGKALYEQAVAPTVEFGGLALGTILGTPSGPAGQVMGAGYGYGMGKKLAGLGREAIESLEGKPIPSKTLGQEVLESAKDIQEGMAYEMGGQLITKYAFAPLWKGGKWVFQKGKGLFAKKAIEKGAADFWVAHTSEGSIYAKNAKEAVQLEESIPGLKFTYGQRTYDPQALRIERAQIRKGGAASQINAEQIASNNRALNEYYQKNFGTDKGVDDFLTQMQKRQVQTIEGVDAASLESQQARELLAKTEEPFVLGRKLSEVLKGEKNLTRKSVSDLYDNIGNPDVPVTNMMEEFTKISKPTSLVESPKNMPESLIRTIKQYAPPEIPEDVKMVADSYKKSGKTLPPELQTELANYLPKDNIPFQELRGIRTEILNEARREAGKAGSNPAKLERLRRMQNTVEETINQLANDEVFNKEVVDNYRFASNQWRIYNEKFKQGTVGQILKRGPLGEPSKMTHEQMVAAVFDAKDIGAGNQLINAIGKEKATPLITEYADYDLLRKSTNPLTGDIDRGKLMSWLHGNKVILQKYGITGRYDKLQQAQELLSQTVKTKSIFEKTQAFKALGVDPDKAISIMFSGKGATNSARTAKELLEFVGNNQAAKEGLRKAFGDNLVEKTRLSIKDIEGDPMASVAKFNALYQKYAPAIRVLYADSPQKIKALLSMKKVYETMIRNQRSPFGGGSDTSELLTSMLASIAAPMVTQRYTIVNAVRTAGKLLQRHQHNLIDQVLNKAIFNPEYAETLKMLAQGGKYTRIGEERFSNHITTLAIAMGYKQGEELLK